MSIAIHASSQLSEQLAAMQSAFRPIVAYLRDPAVVEIMLNPDGTVWVDRLGAGMSLTDVCIEPSDAERMLRYVAAHLQREITSSQATMACKLPLYGARVQALVPPLVAAPAFALRKPAAMVHSLADYVDQGILRAVHADFLQRAVTERLNILIGGGTSSGKTTLVNALLQKVAECKDRVLIIEDTAELQCPAENKLEILVQPPVYSWRQAVMDAMRLRPDRIIVGEVRDGAAHDLAKAWNTGHPGGVATIHANSTRGMLDRFCSLVEEVVPTAPRETIAETIQVCVHMRRDPAHKSGRSISGVDLVRGYERATRQWLLEPVAARALTAPVLVGGDSDQSHSCKV
jgi:P-type conjugative transfer ATPase TrbB